MTLCTLCQKFIIVPQIEEELASPVDFKLSTDRLALQPVSKNNWKELHEIYSNERNYQYEISSTTTPRETKKSIKDSLFPSGLAINQQIKLEIRTLSNAEMIGAITVHFTQPYFVVSLGFMLKHEFHNKGFATEAITSLCRFLHAELGVERIQASCDSKNEACIAVLKKSGFEQEGLCKKLFFHAERGWIDTPIFASLRTPEETNSINA